jgi:hypothetical protein
MYKDLGMTMESTGGRKSTINGKAESPIRTSKATIRAQLIGSSFDNVFWCFAGATGTTVHNNILHTVTKLIPSKQFTGKYIPLKRLHPFGARVKVLTHLPSERSLC